MLSKGDSLLLTPGCQTIAISAIGDDAQDICFTLAMSNEVKSHTTFRTPCVLELVDGRHRAQTYLYGACGMCVRRFGYRSVTRNSTALLKEWSGCLRQYCSSSHSMPSVSVVPRISTVLLVSLFTAVR